MLPEQIPVAAYTHINFAFAMIDPVTFAVAPMSDGDVALYPRLTALKALYPNLKVSLAPCCRCPICLGLRFGDSLLTFSRCGSPSEGGP